MMGGRVVQRFAVHGSTVWCGAVHGGTVRGDMVRGEERAACSGCRLARPGAGRRCRQERGMACVGTGLAACLGDIGSKVGVCLGIWVLVGMVLQAGQVVSQ